MKNALILMVVALIALPCLASASGVSNKIGGDLDKHRWVQLQRDTDDSTSFSITYNEGDTTDAVVLSVPLVTDGDGTGVAPLYVAITQTNSDTDSISYNFRYGFQGLWEPWESSDTKVAVAASGLQIDHLTIAEPFDRIQFEFTATDVSSGENALGVQAWLIKAWTLSGANDD